MLIDEKRIEEFCRVWGSPLYFFDEDAFVRNYKHFEDCLRSVYSNYHVSYSYKTNYAPYICRIVRNLGGYAEVVSDMELTIAKKVGNQAHHIVYNGPCKGPMLEDFLLQGGIVNVDNFEELDRIIAFANCYPDHRIAIGIRVNIDIGQGFISRFGIDDSEIERVFAAVTPIENMKIVGLHCHIGRSRSLEAWRNRAVRMLEIADARDQTQHRCFDLRVRGAFFF